MKISTESRSSSFYTLWRAWRRSREPTIWFWANLGSEKFERVRSLLSTYVRRGGFR